MERTRLKLDILALSLFFAVVFLALSLISYDAADLPNKFVWPANVEARNLCGTAGAHVAYYAFASCGGAVWLLLFQLVLLDALLFLRRSVTDRWLRGIGMALLLVWTSAMLDRFVPSEIAGATAGPGGYLGAFVIGTLESFFSVGGTYLILTATLIVGLFLSLDYVLLRAGRLVLRTCRMVVSRLFASVIGRMRRQPPSETSYGEMPVEPAEDLADDTSEPEPSAPLPINTPDDEIDEHELSINLEQESSGVYQLPSMDLLEDPKPFAYDRHAQAIREKGRVLEKTLGEFGYRVRVVQIDTGPVITQYEIELEAGLRVGKIHSLADDLAIALKAPAVRIVAPIPGKDTVGIEVPNDERAVVCLKEVIRGSGSDKSDMRIPLYLGKDVKGKPLVYDLTKMPHLLIAGRTGTGKSVCLNSLILSVLMTRRPDEVKLLMIDPKMVELSQYRKIPHLMHPVVTDMKKAEALLAWAVDKMEERYDILARAGVRHASSYNRLSEEEIYSRLNPASDEEKARIPKKMPYIVIFADEMADLMMTAPKEVEGHIIRLAQKSRAVGIHLIIATQKPTVDVITGLIKSNLPSRIAFQVSSKSDSRVVLDESSAEKLLGNGDMLFLIPGTSQLVRAQGTYASDSEIEDVVKFLESYEPEYTRELLQLSTSSGEKKDNKGSLRNRDEMYEPAIEVVVREGRGSVSLLQRALGIGYGRAARLIDYMAEDGIVGDYNGSQAREVLFSPEDWEQMKAKMNGAA